MKNLKKKKNNLKRKVRKLTNNKNVNVNLNSTIHDNEDENLFFLNEFNSQKNVQSKVSLLIENIDSKKLFLEIQKCPFCKNFTATYTMKQTRSIDEGSTAEFHCTSENCAKTWRGR
jgi:DNA-directed RNA polymerase subunit M/transcription elongation factor TFIIS